ncbi:MAG TPA: sugar phosphate nucleotidyltransferase [Myxococcota bacterium]|nr:sugar phosphate nucleotidyltransferase [Myxococcota bacterium]
MQGPWSIVLAGGEGRRLRELTTTTSGVTVPKQFCSLAGGPSLLADTVRRARDISELERILVIVTASHRDFWREELRELPAQNVIVQPESRGTAAGILLPLMHVLERDPLGEILVMPSDHHVCDEGVLRRAFVSALEAVRVQPRDIALLGMAAEHADTQYGWIVPAGRARGAAAHAPRRIALFVEKPPAETAERLLLRGGLWSSFVFASRALGLFSAFSDAQPELVSAFCDALPGLLAGGADSPALRHLYHGLTPRDFSRDVMERATDRLCVVSVPPCGWSDLGTPDRVASALGLGRERGRAPARAPAARTRRPVLALALESLAH